MSRHLFLWHRYIFFTMLIWVRWILCISNYGLLRFWTTVYFWLWFSCASSRSLSSWPPGVPQCGLCAATQAAQGLVRYGYFEKKEAKWRAPQKAHLFKRETAKTDSKREERSWKTGTQDQEHKKPELWGSWSAVPPAPLPCGGRLRKARATTD